jgi:hypothetical protein
LKLDTFERIFVSRRSREFVIPERFHRESGFSFNTRFPIKALRDEKLFWLWLEAEL